MHNFFDGLSGVSIVARGFERLGLMKERFKGAPSTVSDAIGDGVALSYTLKARERHVQIQTYFMH